MPRGTIKAGALFAAALILNSSQVRACSFPPPPRPPAQDADESTEAYAGRLRAWHEAQDRARQLAEAQQQSYREGWEGALWSAAERIVLAEIVSEGEVPLRRTDGEIYTHVREVTLRAIHVARGPAQPDTFALHPTGMTSCGFLGPITAANGPIGSRLVIFARAGPIDSESVIGDYSRDNAQDYRTTSLLEGHLPRADD